jgi:hypothetical protein
VTGNAIRNPAIRDDVAWKRLDFAKWGLGARLARSSSRCAKHSCTVGNPTSRPELILPVIPSKSTGIRNPAKPARIGRGQTADIALVFIGLL